MERNWRDTKMDRDLWEETEIAMGMVMETEVQKGTHR